MKLARSIIILAAIAAVSSSLVLDVRPANAACGCVCQPRQKASGDEFSASFYNVCAAAQARLVLPDQADAAACSQVCESQTVPGSVEMPCYIANPTSACSTGRTAGCWCKAASGPYKQTQTPSEADCRQACSGVGREFLSWSNTPPTLPSQNGVASCPPGGIWTQAECESLKNSAGARTGKWDAPAGDDEGPYCFAADVPAKLGVSIGGLTQAGLAQYLAAAYRLGLGVAAILAVIFIMIGGFQYLSAAGGSGVEQAKERIKNAVVGLVLTVASFTLLQTVNPDILSLRLPRVQMVKACNLQVDCRSRRTESDCNKNDSGTKCIWNNPQSICYDNSALQSNSAGAINAECKPDGSCSVGQGTCVDVGGNMRFCSAGGMCQYCNNDTDIDPATGKPRELSDKQGQCGLEPATGKPMKCIDHKCAVLDPAGSGKYKACSDSSCSSGADCASGFCGDRGGVGKKTCVEGDQGTQCFSDDGCNAALNYRCVKATGGAEAPGKCCLNGDALNCMGCNNDGQCPFNDEKRPMFCPNQAGSAVEAAIKSKGLDSTKCADKFGDGEPCGDNDGACLSNKCEGGKCVGAATPALVCDPASPAVVAWLGRVGGSADTDFYCAQNTKNPTYYCNDNKYWMASYPENGRPWNTCVKKRSSGEACCMDAECLSDSCAGGNYLSRCSPSADGSSWHGVCW